MSDASGNASGTTDHASARAAAAKSTGTADLATDLGLLVLRVVLGLGMAAHGAQKLFGWFDGDGIDGTADFFASVGYAPGRPLAILAGVTELAGGLAVALGVLTWLAAAGLAGTLGGALWLGWQQTETYFEAQQGVELELLLLAGSLALALTGPGRLGLDGGRPWNRPSLRLVGFLLGVVAAVAAAVYPDLR